MNLWGLIRSMGLVDVFDIAVVTIIFYSLFRLLRESRSSVALEGMLALLLLSFSIFFIARFLNLNALGLVFEQFWIVIVLAALILFQNEFKRALVDLGQLRILRALFQHSSQYIDEVIAAVQTMSTRRIGALIAIERRNPLRTYADTGTPLDSTVTSELLRTIFTLHSPLHDGAVVIRNERVVAAACILPLTSDTTLSTDLGTRHRAAIGLSEETDALVLTVSEETGIISVAIAGRLERNLSAEDLRRRLMGELHVEMDEESGESQE